MAILQPPGGEPVPPEGERDEKSERSEASRPIRTSQDVERELEQNRHLTRTTSGYDIIRSGRVDGHTAIFNIGIIEATPNAQGLKALDAEINAGARSLGAKEIEINGVYVKNSGFLNPQVARRFGYSFRILPGGTVVQFTRPVR